MLYLVDPVVTGVDHPGAAPLASAVEQCLGVEHPAHVHDLAHLSDAAADDAVVYFNRTGLEPAVGGLLAHLRSRGAMVFPVAMASEDAVPPMAIADLQSYDVQEQLCGRGRSADRIELGAQLFSWWLITIWKPTCGVERLQIFISYGHGEHITLARGLESELDKLKHRPVRDAVDIRAGTEWQPEIRRHLEASDLVLFLDCDYARQSDVVAMELATALELNVPVVWLRVDDGAAEAGRALRIPPSGVKVRLVTLSEIDTNEFDELAVFVLARAYDKRLSRVRSAQHSVAQLDAASRRQGFEVRSVDRRRLIYRVTAPCRAVATPEGRTATSSSCTHANLVSPTARSSTDG